MFLARATTHRSSSVLQLNGIRCPVFRLKLKLNPKPKPLGENLQWRPLSIYGRQRSVDIDTNKLPHNVKSQDFDPSHQGEKPKPAELPALSWTTVNRALVGNGIITVFKFGVYLQTGSSAMLSEAIHTLADCGNQALLLAGLAQASNAPDKRHQYGYGRAAFFWALVSALGMFWTGAGVSVLHGATQLLNPPEVYETSNSLWAVLGISFAVDGYVLGKTLQEVRRVKPADSSLVEYIRTIRDPFLLAVILEDFAACTGVILAGGGIMLTHVTGNIFWDSIASVGIGGLLAAVAVRLVRMNQQFLLGQAIDKETLRGIKAILSQRPGIDAVYAVQSQWVGPSTFSYKAEVDFDGAYLSARLQDKYAPLFQSLFFLSVLFLNQVQSEPEYYHGFVAHGLVFTVAASALEKYSSEHERHILILSISAKKREDVNDLMAWYAEDVTRLVEREVKDVENEIRAIYPAAAYIELEPDSRDSMRGALPRSWSQRNVEVPPKVKPS